MHALPRSDEFWNYWLGKDHREGPVIHHSRIDNKWFVYLGRLDGFLVGSRGMLMRFDDPDEALKFLNKRKG